jgi:hypothetical protein
MRARKKTPNSESRREHLSEVAIRKQRSRHNYLMENIRVILTCRKGKNAYKIFIGNPKGATINAEKELELEIL